MSMQQGVTTAAAPAEGTQTPTQPAEKQIPQFVTDMVASLTKGNAPEIPDPVPAKEEPPKPDPTKQDPPAEKPTATKPDPAKPEPGKQDPPKPEAKAETKAPENTRHPHDEEDDPTGEDIAPQYTKIRKDFEKMREKLRKAREDGQYGRLLASTAARAKMTPEAIAKFVDLGARLNLNDPAAVEEFRQLGEYLGITPRQAAQPPAQPAQPSPQDAEDARLKQVADTIYAEDYKDDVASYLMSEEVARAKALKAAKRIALSQPQPRQQQAPPAQQPGQPPQARLPGMSPLEAEGAAAVARMDAEYAQKIPDWSTKIRPLVQQEVQARRAKDGGISPVYWVTDLADAVNTVRARLAPPAEPPRKLVKVDDTLPANHTAATPGKKQAWDGDDGLRASIASALTGGGKGLDDILEGLPNGR